MSASGGTDVSDSPLQKEVNYKTFIAEFVDVLSDYMMDDAYYCIDGRPVILITPANLGSDALLSIDFNKVVSSFKSDFKSLRSSRKTASWTRPRPSSKNRRISR